MGTVRKLFKLGKNEEQRETYAQVEYWSHDFSACWKNVSDPGETPNRTKKKKRDSQKKGNP